MTTGSSSEEGTSREKTTVLRGEENVVNTVLQFVSNARYGAIDACIDSTRPSLAIEIEQLKNAFVDAKSRGVKLRYVTEVTKHNIKYCKELMKIVDELRHIEGIKGNFYISETEYIAPVGLHEKGKTASQIIYSNVKEIVEYQRQYVFDSFWSRSIPAQHRIIEIEGGLAHYETKVLQTQDEIFRKIKDIIETSDELLNCSQCGALQLIYTNFLDSCKKASDKYRKGEYRGTRWISNVSKDNLKLVKIFLNLGVDIRHVKNLPPMNFSIIPNKEISATIEMQGGNMIETLLTSNEPVYINHFTSIFNELWNQGVDAIERIRDIEAGVDIADIEVIPNSARAQALYLNFVGSSSEEILWIFPTTNAFIRQDKIGAIQLAKQAAKERDVKVRILLPVSDLIESKIQELKQSLSTNLMAVRYIVQMSETKATILVVDRKISLVMELKDDTKSTFYEAIGQSTYSNSKAGVLSYVAIFENLWKQSELYDELMRAHEQLKMHDKMQREFINIAAHELRTPIQPILGLSEVVLSKTKDVEQAKLLEIVSRNAKRLHRLTEDILDVTKIESQSLILNKEQFNLKDVITNSIDDIITNKVSYKSNNNEAMKVLYNRPQEVFVYADKGRITQVISNLLDNATKFTKAEGTITVNVEKKEQKRHNNYQEVVVSIKDTGTGIDPQIMPRLFTKFATTSETRGTGLGLFICKGIVEAHGGNVWAENNIDSKGATFSFCLPITN